MQSKIIPTIVFCAALCGTLLAQEAQQQLAFEVLVLDAEGKPVPDALVASEANTGGGDKSRWQGKTDTDGIVVGLYPARDWGDRIGIFALSPDGQSVQRGTLRRNDQKITLQLQPPVKVTGRIVDTETGKPIPNVHVSLKAYFSTQVHREYYKGGTEPHFMGFVVITDEQGYFRFDKAIPGETYSAIVFKNVSEENPKSMDLHYLRYVGDLWFRDYENSSYIPIRRVESLDIGVAKRDAKEWIISASDRFDYEAKTMSWKVRNLEERFEEMFRRAKKNGRNVLFAANAVYYGTLPKQPVLQPLFDSFEFVGLHTPIGIGRDSRTFEILKEMTKQEVQSDVCWIAFSADGKFLGLLNHDDVFDRRTPDPEKQGEFLNVDKLREFLEEHVPKKP
jgi:hypothetical protein